MYEINSPILDFYPEDFQTDMNGKKQDWEAIVKIPFIDEERLLKAMKSEIPFLWILNARQLLTFITWQVENIVSPRKRGAEMSLVSTAKPSFTMKIKAGFTLRRPVSSRIWRLANINAGQNLSIYQSLEMEWSLSAVCLRACIWEHRRLQVSPP